jgi:hypothetical protein
MKDILLIGSGLLAGLIVWFLKTVLSNQLKAKAKAIISPEGEVNDIEKFNAKKLFEGMGSLVRGDLWGKSLAQELSLRTWAVRLALLGIVIGVWGGYCWYKGKTNKPVQLIINEETEFTIPVPHSDLALYHPKHSTQLQWINTVSGKVIEIVKVKDIPELAKKLRPYGFIIEPVIVGGFGISNAGSGIEGGIGIRYAKYFKWVADVCLTNAGFYPFGVSYKLSDNSAIGLSVGTGFKNGERGFFERWLMKFTVKF